MFVNGQKVVCVDDQFCDAIARFYINLPKKGQVYVVRDMCVGIGFDLQEGEICVYLIGLKNPPSATPPYRERGFKIERFAPLETITEYQEEEIEEFEKAEIKEPVYV
jgi:hypothetical protein